MNKNIIENDNIERSNSKASNIKGYYRIKNNHIFVQSLNGTEFMLSFINDICKDKNQRIHIFDLNPLSIENLIEMIMDKGNKVVIYIPKSLRDYARVLENRYNYIKDRNWKIQIFSKPVIFTNVNASYNKINNIEIKFIDLLNFYFKVKVCKQEDSIMMPLSMYYNRLYHNQPSFYLRTLPQLKYPELFKDRIIHDFKRYNRNNKILKSFNNDDEIWNYILDNIIQYENEKEDYDNGIVI